MKPIAIFPLAIILMTAATSYDSEIAQWRQNRENRLKSESGWLTVAGLFWLNEGDSRFGADQGNDIVLPAGPAHAGVFELHGGKVAARQDGSTRVLAPDSDDHATVGRLRLYVIRRGNKFGIRLRDPGSEYRRDFHGIEYYPVDESYRVTARWVPDPRKIPILNIIGQTEDSDSPGYAVFQLRGKELRLRPILEEPGAKELFYIFRDQTSGKETYGAGRFFYSPMPQNGTVVLDFNKAYNPPCAFTPYATCPLPPKENHLESRVEAGEKKYH